MNIQKNLPFRYRNRWFCYLDLLGFKNLVLQKNKPEEVILIYNEIVEKLISKAESKKSLGISYSWFSDTFIIYTHSDSLNEFTNIESLSRSFFSTLIQNEIPVRGALTFGKLYSQLAKKIFIGEALIDAYEYGEQQNWLGFLLTPKAYEKLKDSKLSVQNLCFYRIMDDENIIRHKNKSNIYAFAFNYLYKNNNPYLRAINRMAGIAPKDTLKKYENTRKFILRHARTN